jgi:2'-5' RNA ligase
LLQDSLRLFFAVFPKNDLIKTVENIQQKLGKGWKPTNLKQLHITLAFLEKVPADRLTEVIDVGNSACLKFTDFELCSNKLTTFTRNGEHEPSILYIQIFSDQLLQLSDLLKEKLPDLSDNKPFKAHITIARKKGEDLSYPEEIPTFKWQATRFKLIQSKLNQNGATHSLIEEFHFSKNKTADS